MAVTVNVFAGLASSLADLVLPRACAGCSRPGGSVCAQCAAALSGPAFVADAGLLAHPAGGVVTTCHAAVQYQGPAREVVLSYKERGRRDAGAALAVGLAVAVAAAIRAAVLRAEVGDGPVLLVPVPSSRAARRARGFDHVHRLARDAAGDPWLVGRGVEVAPLLQVTRALADQAQLGVADRAENLSGAFLGRLTADQVPRRWRGVPLVVVDDVVTTGATVAEAVRALRAGGFGVVGCAVVAATPVRTRPGLPAIAPQVYNTPREGVRLPVRRVPEG